MTGPTTRTTLITTTSAHAPVLPDDLEDELTAASAAANDTTGLSCSDVRLGRDVQQRSQGYRYSADNPNGDEGRLFTTTKRQKVSNPCRR